MKRFSIFLMLGVVLACSHDPLDKQISDPLTIEEIKAQVEKDPSFASRHEFYESLRRVVFTSDTKIALYDATYHDGEQWFSDRARLDTDPGSVKYQATKEWEVSYDKNKAALEDLATEKRKLLKEQGIDSYVEFKFKDIVPSKGTMDRDINFTITPKRGCKIQNYTIHYVINKAGLGSYSNALKGALYKSSFTREEQGWDIQHTNGDWVFDQPFYYKTQGMSTEEITKQYKAYFYVTGIIITTKDGRRLSENNIASTLGIPHTLELYIKDPTNPWELLAIQDCIDESFTSKDVYVNSACEAYLRSRNSKFYKLLDEAGIKYQ